VDLKIAPGTQPQTVQILKNRGINIINSKTRGNQHVICKVELPKNLTQEQQKLLKQAFGVSQDSQNPSKDGVFSYIGNMFKGHEK
jgi:molecular chaperone DnaJ